MSSRGLSPEKIEIARDLHNHVESQATLAVMKSTLLLTAHAFLCAAYIQVAISIKVFEHQTYSYADDLFIESGVLILSAFLISLVSVWPKLKSTDDNELMFFAGIGTMESDEYITKFKNISNDSLAIMLLSNIHGKSAWLIRTFRLIRVAICCSAIGSSQCVMAIWLLNAPHPSPGLIEAIKEIVRHIDITM